MTTGASDGIYLIAAGIPTYGVSGIFGDEDDNRNHGKDERILVKSFYDALEFMYSVATRSRQDSSRANFHNGLDSAALQQ